MERESENTSAESGPQGKNVMFLMLYDTSNSW